MAQPMQVCVLVLQEHLKTTGLVQVETQEELALELMKLFSMCGHIIERLLLTLALFLKIGLIEEHFER